jgi:hypothetical protein
MLSVAENRLTVAVNIFSHLSNLLSKYDINVLPQADAGQEAFLALPVEKQLEVVSKYESYIELIKNDLNEDGTPLSREQEKTLVRKSLDRYKLKHTQGSEEAIETGFLIEIYDREAIQLYRNLEFFRHSGYSLLELASIEWFKLYHRPQQVTDSLLQEIGQKVFVEGVSIRPNVPAHILRETRSSRKKAFLVKVDSIYPLRDTVTNEVTAMLTKIKAELIAEGDEADKIGIA